MQQTIIEYNLPIKINLGDVFYTIEKLNSKHYYEPCQVCGDTRKVTVNGITFDCPCCDKNRVSLSISRYKVTRWRVYSIAQLVSDNGYWKAGSNKREEFLLYTTCERGWGHTTTKKFDTNTFANCRNLDFEKILEVDNSYYGRIDNCVYDCYSLACQVADKLNAYEEQKVKEHNKKFGTNYELPDKPKYDPKSN